MKIHYLTKISEPFLKFICGKNQSVIKCKCDCGNECIKLYSNFKSGRCKYCNDNCKIRRNNTKCLVDYNDTKVAKNKQHVYIGQRFNELIVIEEPYYKVSKQYKLKNPKGKYRRSQYVSCQCDCGHIRDVSTTDLLYKTKKTKGCFCKEKSFKQCTKCNILKPINEFYVSRKNKVRYQSACKTCARIISSISKLSLDITYEELNILISNYSGYCPICTRQIPIDKICIDHDHKTHKVRGLLCRTCNVAIGCFLDDTTILNNAIIYLSNVGKQL